MTAVLNQLVLIGDITEEVIEVCKIKVACKSASS